MHNYYIGVDGGATKSIVRIEDEQGRCLGQEVGGPANIRISVQRAWEAIFSGIHIILEKHQLRLGDPQINFYAGMGLAGCEIEKAYQEFIQFKHPFKKLTLSSDAHTACLGAHLGKDGSVIIIGTGVVGMSAYSGQLIQVGGYGFPHDDRGGGAYLGLEAINLTLRACDGRITHSLLTKAILAHFHHEHALIAWANQANSTLFATLAPFVIDAAKKHDSLAQQLIQQSAQAINEIFHTLQSKTNTILPCALIGSIAPFIEPWLAGAVKTYLRPPEVSPERGAILLARHSTMKE